MALFHGKKVAVIGDAILDRFLEGVVEKRSPEANAPVVMWQKERDVLSGAANVAANIKTLGGIPVLFSVIGNDDAGKIINRLLKRSNIKSCLATDINRVTTVKSRIFADDKYLLRLDKETRIAISKTLSTKILNRFSKEKSSFGAVVFSDYDKGVLSKYLSKSIISLANKQSIPIIADVKPKNISYFKNVTLVKPNAAEAAKMSGTKNLLLSGKIISKKLNSDVVITRGSKGMIVGFRKHPKPVFIEGIKVRTRDIVGAGDVVSACLALGMAANKTVEEAAAIANMAAALSVQKHGTATVSIEEIEISK